MPSSPPIQVAQIRPLLRSTTFRAAAAFGIAGVAHAVANLLLARQLPPLEYAYIALFLAFLDFGAPVGTGGADTVVVRYKLAATAALFRRVLAVALVTGLLIYLVARQFYEFSTVLALIAAFAVVVGACNRVVASIWQSMEWFRHALFQLQSSHLALALLAVVAIMYDWQVALIVIVLHAAYLFGLGTIGWQQTRRVRPEDAPGNGAWPWHECAPIVVITAGAQLAMQTERLLIPHLIEMEQLATYGVLAAVVGSPFQMLSIAVGYTLLPRLKSAPTPARRTKLLKREFVTMLVMCVGGAMAVALLAPWVARLFVGDKFVLTNTLISVAILIGFGKVANAFPMAAIKALGNAADLNRLSITAWLGLAVSVAAAIPMSSWGLPGLLFGIAVGWALRVVLSFALAANVLRRTGIPEVEAVDSDTLTEPGAGPVQADS